MIFFKGWLLLFLLFNSVFIAGQSISDITISDSLIVIPLEEQGLQDINKVKVFRGYLSPEKISKATPVLGFINIDSGVLEFRPIVPFSAENEYTLTYKNQYRYFKIELPENYSYLEVKVLYPTSYYVPENILKFHVKFNHSISDIDPYKHITFYKNSAEEMKRVVLDLENALLNEKGDLLTIWIEPGRQKRDLGPNILLGPPFQVGSKYHIRVEATIKDRNGIPMLSSYEQPFQIIEADRTIPDFQKWNIKPPMKGSLLPLKLEFNDPMDYVSFLAHINIKDALGNNLHGIKRLQENEKTFSFSPNLPWKKGKYYISLGSKMEDLAGNNLLKLFDIDNRKIDSEVQEKRVAPILFEIK